MSGAHSEEVNAWMTIHVRLDTIPRDYEHRVIPAAPKKKKTLDIVISML